MNFLTELRSRFVPALETHLEEIATAETRERELETLLGMIKPAQNPEHGDFQANLAMPLAKRLKKAPRDLADEIVQRLRIDDLCEEPSVAGPGFINLRLRTEVVTDAMRDLITDSRLGVPVTNEPEVYVIDYSAPNVAKPMHVGHLRSSVIGASLYNILTFLGHKVLGDNHIGDWGTQFGMIIYGYKHLLDREAYEQNPFEELARQYRLVNSIERLQTARVRLPELEPKIEAAKQTLTEVKTERKASPKDKSLKRKAKRASEAVEELIARQKADRTTIDEASSELNELADAHPNIRESARQETAKLHRGDEQNRMLWESFMPVCLGALDEMYERLGIRFDLQKGESAYNDQLAGVVEDLTEKEIAGSSEGAVVVRNDGFEAPFMVQKSDGAFTYATTDLATLKERVEELDADHILYVVGVPQAEHFEQLFKTARRWGYTDVELTHVGFGSVLDKETGKMYRTRSGSSVGLESLIDEAIERAHTIVVANDDKKPNGPELDEATRHRIAEIVGIGAIKYADLRINRESDYTFDWDQMLSTTGDSGTYLQYAYARTNGIFRRGDVDPETLRDGNRDRLHIEAPQERTLALTLLSFEPTLEAVLSDYRPNLLAEYLLDLAKAFSQFFQHCPVLKAESDDLKTSRLLLCDLTARTLRLGLNLLGVQTADRM